MGRRCLVAFLALAAIGSSCGARRPEVDGARAYDRVVAQVEMGPRIPGTPGHERFRRWLAAELRRLGGRVEEQRFADSTLARPIEIINLIARWEPARPNPRRLVLAAHYDTRATADRDPDPRRRDQPVPGANDAGSGVAVLLEVAELLAAQRAPVGVELVFFDAEDQGMASRAEEFCLGSRGYAARLSAADRPAAAFVFDMVGDRDLAIHPEANSARRAANLVTLVLEAARATGARGFAETPRYELTDDHLPLLDAGVPAVDIIDFDYPAWHTTSDLPDQVSAASLAEVARVAAWLVYQSPLALAPVR